MTIKEVASKLNVNVFTVKAWIRAGLLESTLTIPKRGGRLRIISDKQLEDYLDRYKK